MSGKIIYRPATVEDAEDITKFLDIAMEGIFDKYFTGIIPGVDYSQLMTGWIEDASQHYSYPNVTVAEKNGQIVGHIMSYDSKLFYPSDEMKQFLPTDHYKWLSQYHNIGVPENSLYIESLAVSEECRSQGIGKQLIESALRRAKDNDYKKLSLFVFEENERGQKFYEREGFNLVKKFNLDSYEFLEPNCNRTGSRLVVRDI